MKSYFTSLILLALSFDVSSQVANFIIPDTVCVNQSISIQNTSTGSTSYYWNFCSGNLASAPIGLNMGNIGFLDRPVYSAIAKDGNDYFVFITNNSDGSLTRLAFGNSLTNIPQSINLGNLGVMGQNIEGIQIKKDIVTGNWFGLIVIGGQVNELVRLSFGNSLSNPPTAYNLGNIDNLMSYSHTIYTFYEGGNWYSLVGNYNISTIIRLNFGNSLANIPTATDLGNIGGLNGPVGFYPIQENGIWYMFVVNRNSNSLSRLNFGASLLNTPSGVNLGDVGSSFNTPRSISVIKDCGKVFGFVVNEGSNDIVRLTFPNGLLSVPSGTSLGNIAYFSFPHHISELFREGDSLYTFVMNVNNNTISRLCFPSCNTSSIPSSNLQNPPSFSYNTPGIYNISLVVNEGMPSQTNICKEVFVKAQTIPVVTGDTILCVGDQLTLISTGNPSDSFLWTGPNGYSSTNQILTISNANVNNAGKYSLTVSGCESFVVNRMVSVAESPVVTGDTSICVGDTLHFASNAAPGISCLWTGPNGFSSTNQSMTIPGVNVNNAGKYTFTSGGCSNAHIDKMVNILKEPTVTGDTTICAGDILNLISSSAPGSSYLWTGPNGFSATSQNLSIPGAKINNAGKYTLKVNSCPNREVERIVSVAVSPTVTGDTAICTGDTLNLISNATLSNSCLWAGPNGYTSTNRNLTILNFNSSQAGRYIFTVSGCENSPVNKIIDIVPGPLVNIGNDTIICQGSTIVLNAGNTGSNYLWNNGANSQSIQVELPGTYYVTVFNGSCNSTDAIFIDNCGSELWFPNVFTPNNDGLNERFRPVSLRLIGSYKILVFNRWGQKLYESNDPYAGWDGTYNGNICPVGVYYFVAEYLLGSQILSVEQRVKRGAVTVLR